MDSETIGTAILTISDSRDASNDSSGDAIAELAKHLGLSVVERRIVTDEFTDIKAALEEISDRPEIDLILTTGGTGLAPRDNTPEATRYVIEREIPGISEAMRRETFSKTPLAMLSRSVAGIRGTTLIINFPGSPKAVQECFAVIAPVLKHAVRIATGHTAH